MRMVPESLNNRGRGADDILPTEYENSKFKVAKWDWYIGIFPLLGTGLFSYKFFTAVWQYRLDLPT